MTRTPEEVFAAHGEALNSADLPRILEDYADDAVLLTADGAFEGRDAISSFFAGALSALPDVQFSFGTAVFGADALLLRWSASSPHGRIEDGVDTFVFADGKIRLQTATFTVVPA